MGFGEFVKSGAAHTSAGARFANSLMRAMNGEKGVVEPTFVKSFLYEGDGVEYFASNVELGPEGVQKIHPVGTMTPEEEELLKACLPECVFPAVVWCRADFPVSRRISRRARVSLRTSDPCIAICGILKSNYLNHEIPSSRVRLSIAKQPSSGICRI